MLNTHVDNYHNHKGSQSVIFVGTVVNANKRRSASSTLQVHGHGVSSTEA